MTGGAVGLGVGTADGVAGHTFWCAGIGRCTCDSVAGRAQGSEIARVGNIQVVVEILYIVGGDVVTVVAGCLVTETDVDIVARHADGFLR